MLPQGFPGSPPQTAAPAVSQGRLPLSEYRSVFLSLTIGKHKGTVTVRGEPTSEQPWGPRERQNPVLRESMFLLELFLNPCEKLLGVIMCLPWGFLVSSEQGERQSVWNSLHRSQPVWMPRSGGVQPPEPSEDLDV